MGRASKRKWENRVLSEKVGAVTKDVFRRKIVMFMFSMFALAVGFGIIGLYFYLTNGTQKKEGTMIAKVTTSMGEFRIELDAQKSPRSVKQFVGFVNDKMYDGLIFHRVIKDFVVQGGDPLGNGMGGNESQVEEDVNDRKNVRGSIAGAKSSGSSKIGMQFFVNLVDNTGLDAEGNRFYPYGRVISGMDVVDKIALVEVDDQQKPVVPVTIISIVIEGSE